MFFFLLINSVITFNVYAEDTIKSDFSKIGNDFKNLGKTIGKEGQRIGKVAASETKQLRVEAASSGKTFAQKCKDLFHDTTTAWNGFWNKKE